jgi:hypothetical protein
MHSKKRTPDAAQFCLFSPLIVAFFLDERADKNVYEARRIWFHFKNFFVLVDKLLFALFDFSWLPRVFTFWQHKSFFVFSIYSDFLRQYLRA